MATKTTRRAKGKGGAASGRKPARKAPAGKASRATGRKPASRPAAKKSSRKAAAAKPAKKASPKRAARKPAKKASPKRVAKPAKKAPKKTPKRAAKPTAKPAKKATPKRAKKPAARKATAKPRAKPAPRKAPPKPKAGTRAAAASLPGAPAEAAKPRRLGKRDLARFHKLLLDLRDRLVDGITFLAGENLNHSQREASGDLSNYGIHMADQGTDNFDREFALNLVSTEQDALYEIDEAIQRIDAGTYGICEMTGRPIERARLEVIPYARYCLEAQQQVEKRGGRYRAFRPVQPAGGEG